MMRHKVRQVGTVAAIDLVAGQIVQARTCEGTIALRVSRCNVEPLRRQELQIWGRAVDGGPELYSTVYDAHRARLPLYVEVV